MSGYTVVTYQINTSHISDSKGNCVNIKLIIIKGQLFSIPKYPGQACSKRQVTELISDCSRKARTRRNLLFLKNIENKCYHFAVLLEERHFSLYSLIFQDRVVNFADEPKTLFCTYTVCMCHKDFTQNLHHGGKHCWLPFVCG